MQLEPGKAYIIRVQHDDWCLFFVTSKPENCNCKPLVQQIEVNQNNADDVAKLITNDNNRTDKLLRGRRQ